MSHVIIATIQRGALNPPEPLDAENQRMVDAVIAYEAAQAEQEGATQMSQWRQRAIAKAPTREGYIYKPAQNLLRKAMGRC